MTNLDILDGQIARQAQVCADAALRLEALQLARRALTDRDVADLKAIGLQLDDDRVSVFFRIADLGPAAAPPTPSPTVGTALVLRPAAVPLPAPDPRPAPKVDNRAALAKEWPADAVAELRRRYAAGEATADIAKAMDRTTKQVTNKAFRLGLRRKTKPCDLALPVQQVAKRPARHAAPKATGRSVPAQTVAERLDALGNGKLWTPQKDLILALSFVRGDSAAKIAGAMALDAGDVTARWQALCPNRNHKAAINALVRELKVRANV